MMHCPPAALFKSIVRPLALLLWLLSTSACASTGPMPASEAAGRWTPADGPYGGRVSALARGPGGTLYAGTRQGLFRRRHGAARWTRLDGSAAEDTTAGASPDALPDGSVRAVAARSDGVLLANFGLGPARSRDGGRTWTDLSYSLSDARGSGGRSTVEPVELAGRALYVGAGGDGLMRSTDDGATWQQVLSVRVKALLRTSEGAIFATSRHGKREDAGPVLYRSADGLDWTEQPAPVLFTSLVEAPGGALLGLGWRRLSGGSLQYELYRSADRGASWSKQALPPERASTLSTGADGRIYAYSTEGLARTSPAGSWKTLLQVPTGVRALISRGDTLYAGSGSGVLRSTDDGRRWTSFSRGLRGSVVEQFARGHDGALYALMGGSLARSTDDGRSWTLAPGTPGRVLEMTAGPNGAVYAVTADAVFRHAPGDMWTHAGAVETGVEGLTVTAGGTLLLYSKRGLFRLESGALAPAPVLPGGDVIGLVRAGPEGIVMASMVESGPYRSLDGGRSFRPISDSLLSGASLRDVAFGSGGVVYAAQRHAVLRSPDRGATWTSMPTRGLTDRPETRSVGDVVVTPGGILLVRTYDGSIFRWSEAQEAWQPPHPAPPAGIEALHVTPAGRLLVGATRGVFRSPRAVPAGAP